MVLDDYCDLYLVVIFIFIFIAFFSIRNVLITILQTVEVI